MLKAFPAPLFRVEKQKKLTGKRLVLTTNLLRNCDQEDEETIVRGDLASMLFAGSLRIYRRLEKYRDPDAEIQYEKDILFASSEHLEYSSSLNARCLHGEKTQGYPYHLAIMAIGIFLENTFPGKVFSGEQDTRSDSPGKQTHGG